LRTTIVNLEGKLADVNAAATVVEDAMLLREWERWAPGRSRAASSSLIGPTRRLLCHGEIHLTPPFNLSRPAPDAHHGAPFAQSSRGEFGASDR
jgi:hypothetical protein